MRRYQADSSEVITKLVKAGYLAPDLQHDADAITSAIFKMKNDLRSGQGEERRTAGPTSEPRIVDCVACVDGNAFHVPPVHQIVPV